MKVKVGLIWRNKTSEEQILDGAQLQIYLRELKTIYLKLYILFENVLLRYIKATHK